MTGIPSFALLCKIFMLGSFFIYLNNIYKTNIQTMADSSNTNITSNSESNAFFSSVTQGPTDAIYDVVEMRRLSKGKDRINLGVGAYRTEDALPYIFSTVTKAENIILQNQS